MELTHRKVMIIGLGKTGISAARFFRARGALVSITDAKPLSELHGALTDLGDTSRGLEVRPYNSIDLEGIDLVIPSPGVPPFNPWLAEARKRGVPVLSEIEIASRFLKKPIVAITGTNGKTTTTSLIGEILNRCGRRAFVGGNIGNPLIDYANTPQEDDFIVAEISSFQLEWAETFHPGTAVLLNTTCDHIDYHGSFEAYRAAKEKIFKNQTADDLAILNGDEPQARETAGRIGADARFFSISSRQTRGIFLEGKVIRSIDPNGSEEVYPLDMIRIPGVHNIENVMAAVLAARRCGCAPEAIIEAVSRFRGVAHRIEFAGEKKGIRFYDDSKGTNVGAVVRALESFSGPIVLLLGGRDKGGDFETLTPLIRKNVKELVLFGEARENIHRLVGGLTKTEIAPTLGEAFHIASRDAATGDVVLLSPGCASFDEFANYAERGRFFKESVRSLPDE